MPGTDSPTRDLRSALDRFRASTPRRMVSIAGLEWESFDTVEGSKTLVALPGAVGGGEASFLLAENLRPQIRVVACGIPAVSSVEQAVGGLHACLDACGVSRAVLLGASYSGLIVQAYVRAYPEEVAGIILSHTGVPERARVPASRRAARLVRALPTGFTRGLLRLLVRALTRDVPGSSFWRDLYADFIAECDRKLLESRYLLTADLCSTARWAPDDLRAWPGRVLIVDSDDDRVASAVTRTKLHALYPRAEVRTFHGTGHSTAMARPREFAEVVRRFMRERAGEEASGAGSGD